VRAERAKGADPSRWIVTTAELCDLLGCSAPTVTRLVKAGLPRQGRAPAYRFDLREVVGYLRAPPPEAADPASASEYTAAQTALAQARRAKVEIESARLAGELVDLEEVRHLMLGLVQRLTSGLEGFAPRTGARLAGAFNLDAAAAQDLLGGEIRHLRDRLAADLRQFEIDYRPVRGPADTPT